MIPFKVGDLVLSRKSGFYYTVIRVHDKIINGGYYLVVKDAKGEEFIMHKKEIKLNGWIVIN